jgi:hypothetical protein
LARLIKDLPPEQRSLLEGLMETALALDKLYIPHTSIYTDLLSRCAGRVDAVRSLYTQRGCHRSGQHAQGN